MVTLCAFCNYFQEEKRRLIKAQLCCSATHRQPVTSLTSLWAEKAYTGNTYSFNPVGNKSIELCSSEINKETGMQTKTAQVRAAIADCEGWYTARSRNIRTLTEPINALWIEVEYHACRMELAEAGGMDKCADFHLEHILRNVTRIHARAQEARR